MIKSHHNTRYIIDKLKLKLWERNNPDSPWLTQGSVSFLDQYLSKDDVLLETGSGRSTMWFAKRVAKVVSIEHHEGWYDKVKLDLKSNNISNVDYYLEGRDFKDSPYDSPYVKRMHSFSDRSFDAILIDGKHRGHIAILGLDKIKEGGIIIIDNIEREIFIDTIAPSRIKNPDVVSEEWTQFLSRTSNCRKVIFGNGVSDTMIVFINSL